MKRFLSLALFVCLVFSLGCGDKSVSTASTAPAGPPVGPKGPAAPPKPSSMD